MANYPTALDDASSLYSPADAFSTKPLDTTATQQILAGDSTVSVASTDGFAPTNPSDIALVHKAARTAKTGLQLQALSRGGSDASCAAAQGLCARPITLAFPCENTHGFEIMHKEAIDRLMALTVEVLRLL